MSIPNFSYIPTGTTLADTLRTASERKIFWEKDNQFQDDAVDKCVVYLKSLFSTKEIENLKSVPIHSPKNYNLRCVFNGLFTCPESKSSRLIDILDKFKCFHPYLERMVTHFDIFRYRLTRYLCELFPDTYATFNLALFNYRAEPPSFVHALAHTGKRNQLLNAFLALIENNRYHVVTSKMNVWNQSVLDYDDSDCISYHTEGELEKFVFFIRTGFDHCVYNSMYVLNPNPPLYFLLRDILPTIIPYLWFHLSKPTEHFSTLCVQYSFPNVEETEMIIILDRINTSLIEFHQSVIDTIHIFDEQCRIVPDFIVEILKNIHLPSVYLFTHKQDSKYLHSLVVSECKSNVDQSHKIKGIAQPAPLPKRKCCKRKL